MQGGLARRATFLNDYQQKHIDVPTLHLDVGGFSMSANLGYEHIIDAILVIYQRLGVEAINISELELYYLQSALPEFAAKTTIPLISANILDKDTGRPLFQPYLVITKGNYRIGLVGIADHTKFSSRFPS
jgi:2',3'-cyclic-nucleotide 2'-phosphodiesterase (5'-nucleotidase family)